MILRFNRSPGAYIAYEYPTRISERLEIETSDLMNIYGIHRMRRTDPNYNELKIKGIRMASFYTGFTLKDYIGLPDIVVTILLSDEDLIPKDFEWILRNYARQILPKTVGENFPEELKNSFHMLKNGEFEALPHEEEIVELPKASDQELFAKIKEQYESSLKNHISALEKESLDHKVIQLEEIIGKQKEEIEKLRQRVKILENENSTLKQSINDLKLLSPKAKAVKQQPKASDHEQIREDWLISKDYDTLEVQISKINMNTIRAIVKPWNLIPKSRTKKDLIIAVIEYCKNH